MRLFVLINLAIILMLLYLFLQDRKKKSGIKLNLNRKNKALDFSSMFGMGKEKQLNVLFNYNGETFDAYEVFGVPAGTSLKDIEPAYSDALKNNPGSRELFDLALRAIRDKKK